MHSASEVTHKVPRGSKGSSQRGESLQGGLERPSRPGLLRDLRGAQELGCTNFDPRVTSSRAFGTLGVAVPYGDSRGRLGRSSEVFWGGRLRFRAHLMLEARSVPPPRPPSPAPRPQPASGRPPSGCPLGLAAEWRRTSRAELRRKAFAQRRPGRARPETAWATHPQPLRSQVRRSPCQ